MFVPSWVGRTWNTHTDRGRAHALVGKKCSFRPLGSSAICKGKAPRSRLHSLHSPATNPHSCRSCPKVIQHSSISWISLISLHRPNLGISAARSTWTMRDGSATAFKLSKRRKENSLQCPPVNRPRLRRRPRPLPWQVGMSET